MLVWSHLPHTKFHTFTYYIINGHIYNWYLCASQGDGACGSPNPIHQRILTECYSFCSWKRGKVKSIQGTAQDNAGMSLWSCGSHRATPQHTYIHADMSLRWSRKNWNLKVQLDRQACVSESDGLAKARNRFTNRRRGLLQINGWCSDCPILFHTMVIPVLLHWSQPITSQILSICIS